MSGREPLPREHGTMRGVRQHWTRHEKLCGPCRETYRTWRNLGEYATKANGAWRGNENGRPALPREHGTVRGYHQHKYREEPQCGPCAEAKRAADRERWQARKGAGDGVGDQEQRELDTTPPVDRPAEASAGAWDEARL